MTERVTQLQWTIDGRRFRSREEYEAALRDKQLVDKIIGSLSLDNPENIEKIYHELRVGKYRFESIVGRQFDDNIYELYSKIKKQKEQEEQQRKESIERRKQNMTRVTQKARSETYNQSADSQDGIPKKRQLTDYDETMQREIIKVLRKKERKRRWIACLCVLICVTSFGYLGMYYHAAAKSQQEFDELLALKEKGAELQTPISNKEVIVNRTQETEKTALTVLPEYELLYQKNQKLIGWIKIEDTVIDYPVMQTINNEYYLDHNFNQEEDRNGCIFMDYQCDVTKECDNTILYGHHMKSGKMFGSLQKYSDETYFKEHPYIQFDTIYEKGTYQVMYVFRSKVYSEEEITFKYYQFINAASQQEFNSYMNEMAELSLYDTGVSASYGDKLLTLSTCDYQESKGRFVVVAKKV